MPEPSAREVARDVLATQGWQFTPQGPVIRGYVTDYEARRVWDALIAALTVYAEQAVAEEREACALAACIYCATVSMHHGPAFRHERWGWIHSTTAKGRAAARGAEFLDCRAAAIRQRATPPPGGEEIEP